MWKYLEYVIGLLLALLFMPAAVFDQHPIAIFVFVCGLILIVDGIARLPTEK
jgi:hypothetical protein